MRSHYVRSMLVVAFLTLNCAVSVHYGSDVSPKRSQGKGGSAFRVAPQQAGEGVITNVNCNTLLCSIVKVHGLSAVRDKQGGSRSRFSVNAAVTGRLSVGSER
jgi:hypothetical protein